MRLLQQHMKSVVTVVGTIALHFHVSYVNGKGNCIIIINSLLDVRKVAAHLLTFPRMYTIIAVRFHWRE